MQPAELISSRVARIDIAASGARWHKTDHPARYRSI
jgi:hypothetical protein